MSKTLALLKESFSEEISKKLAQKIQIAYESNFSCYDPSIGHDGMTFGLMLYKSKVYFINELEKEVEWIKINRRSPYFEFQIGEYILSSYRAGYSMEVDLSNAFPKNRSRVWKLVRNNRNQSWLPFGDGEPDDSNCRHLILADIGNEVAGLQRLFLGIPAEVSPDYRVIRWSTTYEIWNRNEGIKQTGSAIPNNSIPPSKPPVEKIEPPKLKLKESSVKKKKTEENG